MAFETSLVNDALVFKLSDNKSISIINYETFKEFIQASDDNLPTLKANIREKLPILLAAEMDLMDVGCPDVQLEAHAYMKVLQAIIQGVYSKSVEDANILSTNLKNPEEVLVRLDELPQ